MGNAPSAASGVPLPLLLDSRPGIHLFTLWDPIFRQIWSSRESGNGEPLGFVFLFGEEFGFVLSLEAILDTPAGIGCLWAGIP